MKSQTPMNKLGASSGETFARRVLIPHLLEIASGMIVAISLAFMLVK